MHGLGRVPRAADNLTAAGLRFEVMDMDRQRVDAEYRRDRAGWTGFRGLGQGRGGLIS